MIWPIPKTGLVRLKEILKIIPVSKDFWWEGVYSGRFPRPVKISARCLAWKAEDIQELIRIMSDEFTPPTLH